jgi:hypothetical protein
VPHHLEVDVVAAADDCPGECIFVDLPLPPVPPDPSGPADQD